MSARVAVVEDNPDNRLLVRTILEDHYEIEEYEGGHEAVAGIALAPPDLVLLDISLPGLDGVAVLRHLRAVAALDHVPIVALTAHAMAGDRERFLDLGFDEYLTKPIVDEAVLLATIAGRLAARFETAASRH
jgi:CheY-like chemotaxis protein